MTVCVSINIISPADTDTIILNSGYALLGGYGYIILNVHQGSNRSLQVGWIFRGVGVTQLIWELLQKRIIVVMHIHTCNY